MCILSINFDGKRCPLAVLILIFNIKKEFAFHIHELQILFLSELFICLDSLYFLPLMPS